MTVTDLQLLLSQLTPSEKAQILQTLFFDLMNTWPAIDKNPGVSGGDACVVRTRIPVWTLEGYRRLGWGDTEILDNFPTLRASDLAQAWAYVAAHRAEIEQALRANEEA